METKEKTNKEMTYKEKKQENLRELYGFDYAERTKKALISDKTRATLYVRGMVEDFYTLGEWLKICSVLCFHFIPCYTVIMMMKQERNLLKHLNQLKAL